MFGERTPVAQSGSLVKSKQNKKERKQELDNIIIIRTDWLCRDRILFIKSGVNEYYQHQIYNTVRNINLFPENYPSSLEIFPQ